MNSFPTSRRHAGARAARCCSPAASRPPAPVVQAQSGRASLLEPRAGAAQSPIRRRSAAATAAAPPDEPRGRSRRGTGQVINTRAAAQPAPALGATGEATFNFEGESLHAVVKAILGDLLQQNYVIAPNVQGTVTLATPRPVSGAQALSLLEMVLGWNNARLIWSDGRYNIVPADQALAGNLSPRTGSPANARGYEVRAVPLQLHLRQRDGKAAQALRARRTRSCRSTPRAT